MGGIIVVPVYPIKRHRDRQTNHNCDVETLSTRLAAAKADAALTQTELARAAGLKNHSIAGRLESGYRKNSSHIPALAAALGVNALWLAEGRGPRYVMDRDKDHALAEDPGE